jgi:ferric-dicitrate binding protein FerR (iron transport regulator)
LDNDSLDRIDEILLAKYFAQETSPQEERQIQLWLKEDAQNQQFYEDLQKVWQGVEPYRSAKSIDTEAAWQKFKKSIDTEASSSETKVIQLKANKSRLSIWQIAAAAVVLLGISWAIWMNIEPEKPQMVQIETQETGKNIIFSDGSKVFLNKNSRLEYPKKFSENQRIISLSGEGFFEVTPSSLPFIVKTSSFEVKVLGTSFNVKAYAEAEEQEVIVKTGKVAVSSKSKEILLSPNQKAVITEQAAEMQKSENINPNYDSYQSKVFVFEATPLSEVLAQINAVYGAEIVLSDELLGKCPLTVSFKEESLENILEIIVETLSLQLKKEGIKILLSGESC